MGHERKAFIDLGIFSDLSGDGFGFHTDLYGFVRIIWVGEHTDSMSAIKKCQYWQIFNVELIIYGKKQEIQNWDAQIMGIYVLNTYYIGNVAAHIYAKVHTSHFRDGAMDIRI